MFDFVYDIKFVSGVIVILGYFMITFYSDLKSLRSDMQSLRNRVAELENK